MWFDSGELALAAHTSGLGHPPGQPFYQWLGALTSYTPHPLWALNQLSALSLALALPALAELWSRLKGETRLQLSAPQWVLGFLWVGLYPVWDQGARIELYGLGLTLGLWSLVLSDPVTSSPHRQRRQSKRRLVISGLLLGLCGAVQPIFAIGFGIASLPQIIRQLLQSREERAQDHGDVIEEAQEETPKSERWWIQALQSGMSYAVSVFLGFGIPHLYIVYVVTSSEGFVWGNWDSWEAVSDYFRGRDYRLHSYEWSMISTNLERWALWAGERGHLGWCLCGALGILTTRRLQLIWWVIPTGLMGALFPLAYRHYQPEVPDFSGYQLPTLALSLLGLWSLSSWVSDRLRRSAESWLITLLIVYSVVRSDSPPWERSRADHDLPHLLARDWLDGLPPKSLLLVESDHWVFPLMYTQEVERLRPDIVVFNVGFSRSSWYWRWLQSRHPHIPSLSSLDPRTTGAPRLVTLARLHRAVYTESLSLAQRVASPTTHSSKSLLLRVDHCASSWGVNVNCEHPLPLPSAERVVRWAQAPAHQDQITRRVLARLGVDLTERLWSERRPREALKLGYASLGVSPPERADEAPWTEMPSELWSLARQGLIGDPEVLRAILVELTRSASSQASQAELR